MLGLMASEAGAVPLPQAGEVNELPRSSVQPKAIPLWHQSISGEGGTLRALAGTQNIQDQP